MLKAVHRRCDCRPAPGRTGAEALSLLPSAPPFPTKVGPQPDGNAAARLHGPQQLRRRRTGSAPRPPGGKPNACAGQGYCSTAVDHTCHVQNDVPRPGRLRPLRHRRGDEQAGRQRVPIAGLLRDADQRRALQHQRPQPGQERLDAGARRCSRRTGPSSATNCSRKQAEGEIPANQPLPETLGPPPAAFANTGPTYLWISDDNKERGNMTACGVERA